MPKSRTGLLDKSYIKGGISRATNSTTLSASQRIASANRPRPKITDAESKRVYNHIYYLDNRDKIRHHKHEFYLKNRNRILASQKQEPYNSKRKTWYKQWASKNLARIAQYQRNHRLKVKLQQEVNELLQSHYQHQDYIKHDAELFRNAIPNTRSVTV